MTVQYRPGGWCDVATASDGFWLTWADGAVVHWQSIRFDGTLGPERVQPAPEPLMFCRAASGDQDRVLSIHQGHDTGRAWLIGLGRVTDLGLTFGVQPVAIDQAYAYVVRNNQAYDRIRLDNGQSESLPHGVPGSSQGIRDVRDGHIVWADLAQVSALPFATLHQWSAVGDVVVGQADPPQIAGDVRGVPFTAIVGEAYEPHVVMNGLSYAVCARTPQGAAFVLLPPFPEFSGGVQPPDTPPIHPPTPEPKPMPVPDKSAFAASFLGPRLALVGSMDETRAHTFAAVREGCVELRKTDPRFGLLAKTSGDNVDGFAADIWLYDLGDQTAQVIDVVNNGEGAPNDHGERTAPSPGWGLKDIRPISQWREPSGAVQTHAYDGGEHDTGTCDICGQPRNAPIHQVSQQPGPAPVPAQRPDTAAVIATLQGAIAALARIAPDRPEPGQPPPAPPPVVVEREHPSYDDMMATINDAAKAYGRKIMPPETSAHLMFGYLIEGRTRESIIADAAERGHG